MCQRGYSAGAEKNERKKAKQYNKSLDSVY